MAAAVPALSDAERQVHDWIRFTPPSVEADETSPGSTTGGHFTKRGLAIAGVGLARTASKMWSGGAFGIPDATPSSGPEVGLLRHVLSEPSAAGLRDDAAPLRVLKAAIGAAAFDWLRAVHGRPGDGLVTAHPFTGFAPALLTPPMWTQEGGTEMGIVGHATTAGVLHGLVLARGAATPTAAEVAAGADVPGRFAAFHRDVAAGDFDVLTGEGSFAADATQDGWIVLEASDGGVSTGRLTPPFHLVRAPSVAFASPPAVPPAPSGGATLAWTAAASGTDSRAIWPGDAPFRRPEDVEFGAFQPVAWGRVVDHGPDHAASVDVAGLTPGATHTLQVALRRAHDAHPDAGALGETRRIVFAAL